MLQNLRCYEHYIVANNEVIPQKNETDAVWDRHAIDDSMPLDYVIKYPNTYYNELDNKAFMDGLYKTFQPNPLWMNGSEWTPQIPVNRQHIPPKMLTEQYGTILPWIEERLNANAKDNFQIPGDSSAPFQIIHDRWNSWSKNILTPNSFMYNVDLVIYREAKYHAKHVRFAIIGDKQGILGVAEIKMLGIIFEDKFGLFPVIQSDMTDLELSKTAPFDSDVWFATYPPLIDENTIASEVLRREEQTTLNEKITKILAKSPPQW